MTVIAINGSPRKNRNTHILLTKALEGAASKGGETELVHLYDLNYKGCTGCLECKRKAGASIGKCVINDDLKPLLEKIEICDALIFGSPIYFGEVTGAMRSFIERLLFQYLSYDKDRKPLFKRRIKTAFLYTMNVSEESLQQIGYADKFKANAALLERILGQSQTLISTETLQVDDYNKYNMTMFDAEQRKQRNKNVFPLDCQKAYEIGAAMAE